MGVGEGVPVRVHMFVCTCVCACVIELTRLNARAQVRWPHDPRFVHPKPKLKAEKAQCGSASGSDEVPFTVTAKGERTCVWVRRESPMLKQANRPVHSGQHMSHSIVNRFKRSSPEPDRAKIEPSQAERWEIHKVLGLHNTGCSA